MVSTHHLLHTYCENPPLRFSTQDAEENVVLTLRAHPITLVLWVLLAILGMLLPILAGPFLNFLPLNSTQQLFIILTWYAFILLFILSNLITWYFNLGIITTRKIIDVDVINILNSHTTETLISRIEEVNNKSKGFLSSLFNYGNIYVQTAGEEQNIEFLNVPYPARIVRMINDLMTQQPPRNE